MPINSPIDDPAWWKIMWTGACIAAGGISSAFFWIGKYETTARKHEEKIRNIEHRLDACVSVPNCLDYRESCTLHQNSEFSHGLGRFVQIERNMAVLGERLDAFTSQSESHHRDIIDLIKSRLPDESSRKS